MALMDDCLEWLDFCEDLIREISDSKLSDFKQGQIDGIRLATDMLKDYLVDYPGYVDPKHKLDKFKM